MPVSLIVAQANHGIIGRDGGLPWRQSADLVRFKRLTMGHHLLMGRKTFASLGRVLPGRTSIVLSRQPDLQLPPGVLVATSMDQALSLCGEDAEPFVIGGGEIYKLALPHVQRIHLTRILADIAGDTKFPEIDATHWRLVEVEPHSADAKNEHDYAFEVWERA